VSEECQKRLTKLIYGQKAHLLSSSSLDQSTIFFSSMKETMSPFTNNDTPLLEVRKSRTWRIKNRGENPIANSLLLFLQFACFLYNQRNFNSSLRFHWWKNRLEDWLKNGCRRRQTIQFNCLQRTSINQIIIIRRWTEPLRFNGCFLSRLITYDSSIADSCNYCMRKWRRGSHQTSSSKQCSKNSSLLWYQRPHVLASTGIQQFRRMLVKK